MSGKAKGSAATHHWIMQRASAIALVPLTVWFVISLIVYAGAPYEEVREWVGSPGPAVMLIVLVVASFYHANLGLYEVVEDYIANPPVKSVAKVLVTVACVILGLIGVFSVLKIGFGG